MGDTNEPRFRSTLSTMPWRWAAGGAIGMAILVAGITGQTGVDEARTAARVLLAASLTIVLSDAFGATSVNARLTWTAIGVLTAGAIATAILHRIGTGG